MILTAAACSDTGAGANTTAATTNAATTAAATTAAATTAAATTAAATTAATPPATTEPITIKWMGAEYMEVAPDAPVVKFFEDKFNIKVEATYIEAARRQELLNLRFASNDPLDVFTVPDFNTYTEWARQGVLAEISRDTLIKYAPDIATQIDGWEKDTGEKIWPRAVVDDVSYGIPFLNVDSTYPGPVIWRDDWLTKVGINKTPETLDEFKTALYAFTNDDPDGNGTKDTYGLSLDGFNAIYGTAGSWYTNWTVGSDGKLYYGATDPNFKEVLSTLAQWYKDGVIDPEFATGENQGGYWAISHSFCNGRIGMTAKASFYHWNYPLFEGDVGGVGDYETFIATQPNGHYVFGTPAMKDGKGGRSINSIVATVTVLGAQVQDDEPKFAKILEIYNAVATDYDLYLTAKYGIEGTHWNYDANKQIVVKPEFSNLAQSIGTGNMFCPWQNMHFYKQMGAFRYKFADETVGKYPKYLNAVVVTLPSAPDYSADLDKLRDEMITQIISGAKPVDYFDEFVTEWNKIGGDTMTKEANEYYAANK